MKHQIFPLMEIDFFEHTFLLNVIHLSNNQSSFFLLIHPSFLLVPQLVIFFL